MSDLFARAPHLSTPSRRSVTRVMLLVLLAGVPGIAAHLWWFGAGLLWQLVWCCLLALLIETLIASLRRLPLKPMLGDCSALVTATLLALTLPPNSPWWVGAVAVVSALLLGKHIYGGLGNNPFNPAMVGYLVVLIAFPVELTNWVTPSSGISMSESLALFLGNASGSPDQWTSATALEAFKLERGAMHAQELMQTHPAFGTWSGKGVEWINLAFLMGGLFMLQRRLFAWHAPVGMLAALTLLSFIFWDGGSSAGHGSPLLHLFSGGTMLGAFFILTDPSSSSASNIGRLLCGILTGVVVYCIRIWGNYPDAIAFGVLFSNFAAPLIDYYLQPRVYGDK